MSLDKLTQTPMLQPELKQLCRVCNVSSKAALPIFQPHSIDGDGELTTLAALLRLCANLDVLEEENFMPSYMCKDCVDWLKHVYHFRRTAERTDLLLRKRHKHTQARLNAESDEYIFVLEQAYLETLETSTVCSQKQEPEPYEDMLSDELQLECEAFESAVPVDKQQQPAAGDEAAPKRRYRSQNFMLQCGICGKYLSTTNSFNYHMRLHGDECPYVCEICGAAFKTRNAYDGHVTLHNPDNPNKCHLCPKTYRQASSLRAHLLTHSGIKPFSCDICGKGLTQKSGYKKHMLTHTGEKPHHCDICGRHFRYSSNLIAHKRSHTRNSIKTPRAAPGSVKKRTRKRARKKEKERDSQSELDI
ncbi:CG2712 [Drosophila busckii]|uniref:CG2712 n=1 Tax=Drosophila busckii TaxID=30019 RepID=A0A0M4F9K4_DROBS|nr:zinc finger protein 16 [Drosophila busckii]ALC48920.1 CG2712 [Drosophila busckii]